MTTLERTAVALAMALSKKVVTVNDLVEALNVSPRQAYRYLKAICNAYPTHDWGGKIYNLNPKHDLFITRASKDTDQ